MIQQFHVETGGVAVDTRYEPVVVSSWEGVASVELVDRYFRWSDAMAAAAMAREQRIVHVTDLTECRMPPAAVRKRAIEHCSANPAAEISLAHIIVVPEPRLRTLVSSIARFVSPWIAQPELVFAASVEGALAQALQKLWQARIPPPMGLRPEGYEAPRLALRR